ncbi:type-F conjugative transfer system pilin assembly protein TrbC [Klebsiella aerogenes]|uniref:type-F conjugative transfer system pilin assembly protein TrbC n=1 Tax=Klebsiella aerogenes TaxID=548 RepID=UPI002E3041FB|nr:type-F conjugative transfer system pilin assembly protein TrbC [Klebsiella aerogenes]MED7793166.1 type-F conjugative transfer system pilin assembly protein TrbC [Klebsiella aerogenes]
MLKSTLRVAGLLLLCGTVQAAQQEANRQFLNEQLQVDRQRHQALAGKLFAPTPQTSPQYRSFTDQLKAQQQARLTQKQKEQPRIMMFVSFSLPEAELKQRVADAAHYGIPVIIRGMVNGNMRQTATAVGRLVQETKTGGVEIEPTLFRQFSVTVVPQLIVTCEGHIDRLSGDLALPVALKKVTAEGDCAAIARKRLGGGADGSD